MFNGRRDNRQSWKTRWSALKGRFTYTSQNHRIIEYTKLVPEADDIGEESPPDTWPEFGRIEAKHLSVVYPGTSKKVIKDISFVIPSGSKVGVVGRTGAGKSSFLQALFRLVEHDGEILIDGISTKTLGLNDLRSRIAIIPQEPFAWQGTYVVH